jgi:uncharacterized membrane protein
MYKPSSSMLVDFANASISPVILMDLTLSEADLGTNWFEFNSVNEGPGGVALVAVVFYAKTLQFVVIPV